MMTMPAAQQLADVEAVDVVTPARVGRYGYTSWALSLANSGIDLLPPFLRRPLLRVALGAMGRDVLVDYGVFLSGPSRIFLGSDVYLGRGTAVFASTRRGQEADVRIGDHVLVAPFGLITTLSHDPGRLDLAKRTASVRVGDHAWIGAGALVLPGADVGEGTVVAAGAVVTGALPAWTICAGVPARPVKDRVVS